MPFSLITFSLLKVSLKTNSCRCGARVNVPGIRIGWGNIRLIKLDIRLFKLDIRLFKLDIRLIESDIILIGHNIRAKYSFTRVKECLQE